MGNVTIYDKAKWHYEHESFPVNLNKESGAIYGGFFLVWMYLNKLIDTEFMEEAREIFNTLDQREITPARFYFELGGVLASDMFTDTGNEFANHCFESHDFDYYYLFENTLARELESPYHVSDRWDLFDKLCPKLNEEFHRWKLISRNGSIT